MTMSCTRLITADTSKINIILQSKRKKYILHTGHTQHQSLFLSRNATLSQRDCPGAMVCACSQFQLLSQLIATAHVRRDKTNKKTKRKQYFLNLRMFHVWLVPLAISYCSSDYFSHGSIQELARLRTSHGDLTDLKRTIISQRFKTFPLLSRRK